MRASVMVTVVGQSSSQQVSDASMVRSNDRPRTHHDDRREVLAHGHRLGAVAILLRRGAAGHERGGSNRRGGRAHRARRCHHDGSWGRTAATVRRATYATPGRPRPMRTARSIGAPLASRRRLARMRPPTRAHASIACSRSAHSAHPHSLVATEAARGHLFARSAGQLSATLHAPRAPRPRPVQQRSHRRVPRARHRRQRAARAGLAATAAASRRCAPRGPTPAARVYSPARDDRAQTVSI